MALLAALVLALVFGFTAAALVPLAITERLLAAAHREAVECQFAAEAVLLHAVGELQSFTRWDDVLEGRGTGSLTDSTVTPIVGSGRRVDLAAIGRGLPASTPGNWGLDAPQWALFEWGRAERMAPGGIRSPIYVAVWAADDEEDGDGNPHRDANGRLLLHGEAYGPVSGRRAVLAKVARQAPSPAALKVLTWRLP